MGRPLRRHAPQTFYLVTIRCFRAQFLCRPDAHLNQAVLEWLARAQQRFPGVRLFAVCVMSNHLHLLVLDRHGELAPWTSYFFGNLAKAINRIRGRSGPVFERRHSAEPILDQAALLDRLLYILNNPAKANLCAHGDDWPGIRLWARSGEPERLEVSWIHRGAYARARRRSERRGERRPSSKDFRVRAPLILDSLAPEDEDAAQHAHDIHAQMAERERALAKERARAGRPAMTRAQVLAQSWQSAPRHPKRSPRPLCHSSDRSLRRAFREAWEEFVGAYHAASALWSQGARSGVAFPLWCYPPGGPLVRALA
jgi:hypothetical protein